MREDKKDTAANESHKRHRWVPITLNILAWIGLVVVWFVAITLFMDTPKEHRLRHSTDELRAEYNTLSAYYDELSQVMDNVIERDINVFRKLFEANPYDLNSEYNNQRYELELGLSGMDNKELSETFDERLRKAEEMFNELNSSHEDIIYVYSHDNTSHSIDYIPSIQPINNSQLTLLAAGKKSLINPFHRAMQEHHGVDYLIPEGTPVFATANGRVESLSEKNSTHGKAIIIDHGNGYKTSYSHLLDIRKKVGDKVSRGDIIALSGNSGLSFAPHLHYEVIYNDTRVNPVHYFFMELNPEEYQRIIRIATSSMQSFD